MKPGDVVLITLNIPSGLRGPHGQSDAKVTGTLQKQSPEYKMIWRVHINVPGNIGPIAVHEGNLTIIGHEVIDPVFNRVLEDCGRRW